MGFDWGDETYKYRVHVVPLASGRFTWKLVIAGNEDGGESDSVEEGRQEFDSADAADEAGKNRMIELAREGRTGRD